MALIKTTRKERIVLKIKKGIKRYLPKLVLSLVSKTYIAYIKLKRFFFSVKEISNPWGYILDTLGLKKGLYFIIVKGNVIFLRAKTADRIMVDDVVSEKQYFKEIKGKLSTVIDLGAHIGLFSALIDAEKVYAIEASKENFEILKKNASESSKKILPFHLAIADNDKGVKLYSGRMNARHSIMIHDTEKFELVKSSTLEDFLIQNDISSCDLLKMDIEGAEYKIFYSTPKEVFSKIKSIVMELHDVKGESKSKFVKYLIKQGYDVKYNGKNFLWASLIENKGGKRN